MTPLLVIEDSVVFAMLQNAKLRETFRFLQTAADKRAHLSKACGRCGSQRVYQQQQAAVMNGVRAAIAAMPGTQKLAFKKALNAQKVRLIYIAGGGRRQMLTF